ncbi:pyruvate kinase [Rozella allomycis CSF55]|uniref:Pyruvate kinase n=1 Tax=Rozella allomycis (strain CSF55) TaxID=988480 RepID=A0A4P9YQ43_ROZAC|nr:pyruvate kinase [Rozella allomycis CSF55]
MRPKILGNTAAYTELHTNNIPTRLSWIAGINVDQHPVGIRKTSIICTIGPKTNSPKVMADLRKAGMNIARLNFSHGSHEYHATAVQNVRDSFKLYDDRPVAIALDTKGPEIRTGNLKDEGGILIPEGHVFLITTDDKRMNDGDLDTIYMDYKNLPSAVKVNGKIFVDDGILSLTVLECSGNTVKVKANNSHRLLNHKGVNLPDAEDLKFAVKHNLDMIFASFIRKPEDVIEIRKILGEQGKDIKIISKIESTEGLKNFDDILEVSDGIMVARGDLGIEIPPEKVFLAQKMIIARCNIVGKPVICATQMLESMTQNPRPTRAEVADVSNAILDGSDCVMLSAETARGTYPVETVQMMHKIVIEAESTISYVPLFEELRNLSFQSSGPTETIACAAVNASLEDYIEAIIVLTTTGESARFVAKFRPAVPIITVTRSEFVARQIHLSRGCYPLYYEEKKISSWQDDVDARISYAVTQGKKMGLLKPNSHVVVIQGHQGGHGNTNTMKVIQVPE